MAEILLVHGIAQEQKSAPKLVGEWRPDLVRGLQNAGCPDLASSVADDSVSIEMAFYGGLFLTPDAMGSDDELDVEDTELVNAIATEWLERASNRSSLASARHEAITGLTEVRASGEPMGARSATRHITSRLARLPWFAKPTFAFARSMINRSLRQVSQYLSNAHGIRDAAQDIVERALTNETRVIVSHSLGSVVAYETCHRLQRSIPTLVTMGSPIGLHTIVFDRLEPQPPTYPEQLDRWVNVADKDDLVAAEPELHRLFGRSVEDHQVDNGSEPHSASQYLSQQHVGEAVASALEPLQ